MIYDLTFAVGNLTSKNALDRHTEATLNFPQVGIVAMNGIPFIGQDPVTYFGTPVTLDLLREQIRLGLGFGGVLTYMNRSRFSLEKLADLSLEADHDWAMHSVNITLCFSGAPTFVEMSFARDRRFHLSWVDSSAQNENWDMPRLFTATASWKDWRSFLRHQDSPDFQPSVRYWLSLAHQELCTVFPEYMA